MNGKALVLLSGGLDSATVLHIALEKGFAVSAISFRYGQRHCHELNAAAAVVERAGVEDHRVIVLDPALFAGSSLTDGGRVPRNRSSGEISSEIPSTYVPARNTVFLSMALARAEVIGSDAIFIGVNSLDYSGYPDCRPEYIEAFQRLADLATKRSVHGNPVRVEAPLLHMTKSEIIAEGMKLGVDYSITSSCYSPDSTGRACGECDACTLRLRGFREAGFNDPAPYQDGGK